MGGTDHTRLHIAGPLVPVDSAAFLRALLDSLTVGVAACDADGRLVVLNQALRETHRLAATAEGTAVTGGDSAVVARDLFYPDGAPMPLDQTPLARCARGERVQDMDIVIQPSGQRSRTFSTTGRAISDPAGRSLGAVVALHEVTAMRRVGRFRGCHLRVLTVLAHARSAADAAPEVLRAVAESLGWPHAELWLCDDVTGLLQQTGRFSDPSLDLHDLADETVVKGVGVTGTVWQTAAPLWVPDITTSVYCRSPGSQTLLDTYVRNGLRTVVAVPILDGNDVLGVLTCFADTPEYQEDLITVLLGGVAAQIGQFLLLRRSEALGRELLRAKDDFIALAGHELRTPLTAIAGYVSILDEDGGLDDEQRRMMHTVRMNTDAVCAIIDDLLDLAALESGEQPLAAADIDLAEIGAAAVAAARPTATANNVRITAELPGAMIVNADPRRMRQAVDNVLSNAVKYSLSGGHVHLRLSRRRGVVELRVSDNGIGIPRNERDRLFDRFYRASNVRHQGFRGNGLGLSLVRAIIEAHGGSIALTNRGPTGAVALIRLPRTPASEEA